MVTFASSGTPLRRIEDVCRLDIAVNDALFVEFLDGETLKHLMQQGPLAIDPVIEIAIEVADALEAAHVAMKVRSPSSANCAFYRWHRSGLSARIAGDPGYLEGVWSVALTIGVRPVILPPGRGCTIFKPRVLSRKLERGCRYSEVQMEAQLNLSGCQ